MPSTFLSLPLLLCLLSTTSYAIFLATGVAAVEVAAVVAVKNRRRIFASPSFFVTNDVSYCWHQKRQKVEHRRQCQQLLHGVIGIGSVRPRSVSSTLLLSTSSSSASSSSRHQHLEQQQHPRQQHHSSGGRWKGRRAKHSFLPPPTQSLSSIDEKAILSQLGYVPSNVCRVSARSSDLERMNSKGAATTCLGATANTASAGMKDDITTSVDISADGYGRPIAIQCYPLIVQLVSSMSSDDDEHVVDGERNTEDEGSTANRAAATKTQSSSRATTIITPFPTLYWLTCPHVSRAISELEREGYARIFRERLEQEEKMKMWRACHDQYASERWNSLSEEDQRRLLLPPPPPPITSSSMRATTEFDDEHDNNDMEERRMRESMRSILQYSGVAGTEYQYYYHDDNIPIASSSSNNSGLSRKISPLPSVKCLHAHYAHYRSQVSSFDNDKNGAMSDEREGMAINIVGMWTHEILLERFPEILF